MSAIFGETLTFAQEAGPDIRLTTFGDEFYARYEDADGYTAVYDADLGQWCYAMLVDDRFVSTAVSLAERPPAGIPRHLEEPESRRRYLYDLRRGRSMPPPEAVRAETMRTLGPNQGLLTGRRLNSGSVRGLTILVEFQDVGTTVTRNDVSDLLNADDYTRNGNFSSVRGYFKTVSTGVLGYKNDVVGAFKLSKPRRYHAPKPLVEEASTSRWNRGSVDYDRRPGIWTVGP